MSDALIYPDVIGSIAGRKRFVTEELQFAVGIFPKQAFINQPIELVILLQSRLNIGQQVRINLGLPNQDKQGNPLLVEASKNQLNMKLGPGEAGVLRVPIVAHPPTPPNVGYPIRIQIRSKVDERQTGKLRQVRPPDGGPPPSVLTVSPFRLQVFKDIDFLQRETGPLRDYVVMTFDLAPKTLPQTPTNLAPRYEKLWEEPHIHEEQKLVRARLEDARRIGLGMGHPISYWALLDATNERFEERGLPLHPGEAKAIAKMLAYTVDDAPELETNINAEETRWFRTLCQVLAHDDSVLNMERADLLAKYCYDAIVYDAVLYAFNILQQRVSENLGNNAERHQYANTVTSWLAGSGDYDLNYIYLPLAMGGFLVNRIVKIASQENPWDLLEELDEAYQGRIRLASSEEVIVFDMLETLLSDAVRTLKRQRVERPTR